MVLEDGPAAPADGGPRRGDEQHRPQGRPHPAGRRRTPPLRRRPRRLLLGRPQAADRAVGLARRRRSSRTRSRASSASARASTATSARRCATCSRRSRCGRRGDGVDGLLADGTIPAPLPDLAGDPLAAVLTVARPDGRRGGRTPVAGSARYAPEVRMRRWNGWGDDQVTVPWPRPPATCWSGSSGPGTPPRDATLEEVVAGVPPSRLRPDVRLDLDPRPGSATPAARACPTGSPLRSGRLGPCRTPWRTRSAAPTSATCSPSAAGPWRAAHPVRRRDERRRRRDRPARRRTGRHGRARRDGRVARPRPGERARDVRRRRRRARRSRRRSHASGLDARALPAVVRVLDGRRLGRGALGRPGIDRVGTDRGTCSPAATSRRRRGPLDLPTHPASAAGPDLRQLVLGSEGRVGIITDVVVRARPIARDHETFGVRARTGRGRSAFARALAQCGPPAVDGPRLDAARDRDDLRAGRRRARRAVSCAATSACAARMASGASRSSGSPAPTGVVGAATRDIGAIAVGAQAIGVARASAAAWRASSGFAAPYLRNTLWEAGYAVDTLETAVDWSSPRAACGGPRSGAPARPRAARRARPRVQPPVARLPRAARACTRPTSSGWRPTRTRRSSAGAGSRPRRARSSSAHGGTISHQHGVGTDHVGYLEAEKGPLGMAALRGAFAAFDPDGIMAPGVLLGRAAMTADTVVAIDVGTQSVRAIVFDPAGTRARRGDGPDRAVRLAAPGLGRAGSRALLALDRRGLPPTARRPGRPPRRDRRR